MLILYLKHMDNLTVREFKNVSSNLSFSWPNFTVNNENLYYSRYSKLRKVKIQRVYIIDPIV